MEFCPLKSGLYILRFEKCVKPQQIDIIVKDFNSVGEKYGIKFIPEIPGLYQILGKDEQNDSNQM